MIAARLAGGNLFFAFFGWGDFWWGFLEHSEHSEHSDFLRGFCGGDFWEHSEHSDFFEGIFFVGGFFFLWGGGGCFGL